MKKIVFSLLMVAAAMNLMAITVTDKAKVTLVSSSNKTCALTVLQSPDLNAGYNSGYCGEINMEGREVALYLINDAKNYQSFGTRSLSDMPLGVVTNADTNYELQFSNVAGTMTIYDAVLDSTITLVNSQAYAFTATANSTINDRFFINYVPAAPEICHRYGKLQVTGMKDTNVVVKNMDDSATSIGTVAITANYQEIDLAGLAAGQYKVEYNDGTARTVIIDVK